MSEGVSRVRAGKCWSSWLVVASLLVGCGASQVAPSPSPAASGATGSEGAPDAGIVVSGRGSCARNDECVLSGYAEGVDGCCNLESTCGLYATSKAELEMRRRENTCRPSNPPKCPPPTPCPSSQVTLDRAACVDGVCAAVGH
jgi:hypothetical protein